ncbi:MAG: urease accessory protein [Betaproteobacteria bacterium]|nr:urease accessory protein [Betaproteobacteria bacterium]
MQVDAVIAPGHAGWEASLKLEFSCPQAPRTTLTRREHSGPLRVQKALYPEGERICHAVIVHPPGGIAGGDQLHVDIDVGSGAHALITTPGATKWYKANGRRAQQEIAVRVAAGAVLEWLPQETIVYDQADTLSATQVALADDALYLGWEVLCLGRRASGESFDNGRHRQRFSLRQGGKLLWNEQGALAGGSNALSCAVGFAGATVCGTLLAAGRPVTQALLDESRAAIASRTDVSRLALTRLPNLLAARYLGPSSEDAKQAFAALWQVLRPALTGHAAVMPRLWST